MYSAGSRYQGYLACQPSILVKPCHPDLVYMSEHHERRLKQSLYLQRMQGDHLTASIISDSSAEKTEPCNRHQTSCILTTLKPVTLKCRGTLTGRADCALTWSSSWEYCDWCKTRFDGSQYFCMVHYAGFP